jgi:hypothetical protein
MTYMEVGNAIGLSGSADHIPGGQSLLMCHSIRASKHFKCQLDIPTIFIEVNTMLYELTVVQFSKMLKNLSAILEKGESFAETKKIDANILPNSRLAVDQFNLIRQIQIACDTAKLGVARLAGKEDTAPKHEDNETTISEL